MKILKVQIQNFRKLINIEFNCKETINTIVGPNGIGKSSIIEAIRLAKSVLLQAQDNEAQATLQNMGIFSPQNQSILFNTICNDQDKQIKIQLTIKLSTDELELANFKINDFAFLRLLNQMGQTQNNRLSLVGYLSTPIGRQQYGQMIEDTRRTIEDFKKEKRNANIELLITSSQVSGNNAFDQELVSFILRNTNIDKTLFSIFPADRNFPTGDVNIQLGQADLQQQVQSYSIQPNLKFHRLKNTIINHLLMNNNDITSIREDFRLIFENLLPGKELFGIKIENTTNRLSVLIKETNTKAIYDIDFLSSGEKGLLLTLFLLIRTVEKGGIIIIDEPELHLNPAVCKNIISFLKNYIVDKQDVQIILTTHSAEILTSTKENEQFQLLHLIDSNTISPIYKNDNNEAAEAIRTLGVSTADLLFNKGVIYLEGNTDEEYINEILKNYTVNFKVQSLGGRTVVENEIKILQESDKVNRLKGLHIFILDFDNKPTDLRDTTNVKIIQWDRYSFENYLLDTDVMYTIIRGNNPKGFPSSRTEFTREIKRLALTQIDSIATIEIAERNIPKTLSISKKEIGNSSNSSEIASALSDKIKALKEQLNTFEKTTWEEKFIKDVENKTVELRRTGKKIGKNIAKGKSY